MLCRLLRSSSLLGRLRPLCSSSSSSPSSTPSHHPRPAIYSFLNPSLFSPQPPPPQPAQQQPSPPPPPPPPTLSSLASAISSGDPNAAWLSFRALASRSVFPSPDLSHSLISLLLLLPRDIPNLKRALAASLLLLRRSPHPQPLPHHTLSTLLRALSLARAPSPALVLTRAALPSLPPFSSWGPLLLPLASSSPSLNPHLVSLLHLACRVATLSHSPGVAPDLHAFNSALQASCRLSGSLHDADHLLRLMASQGIPPDPRSLGSLAYLYAWKGILKRVEELEGIVKGWEFREKCVIYVGLVGGYLRCAAFDLVSESVLRIAIQLRDAGCGGDWGGLGREVNVELVRCFAEGGRIKDLAGLIIRSQEVESGIEGLGIECSVGFGVVDACIGLGWLDKAHSILDEMNARGASVGLGVYNPILRACCKEGRTAEAVQLVGQIRAAGLEIDRGSYDALVDASMTAQDFQSAFGLFRGMREAGFADLKTSYLTIMTGLMENHRPELMAGFLDSLIGDPRVEVATHDWNSIIHAFCKVGRLGDAKRTYRRMTFLQFEPNEQTYLSLINGYVGGEKYFDVLMLWTEVKRKKSKKFDNALVDAFLYTFVKGGFFDAALEVIEKAQELKIFIDKWRYKHAFMENHKKLKMLRRRRKDPKKKEALIAFKNWAGLNA